jgi:hypothetical protein
MAVQRLARRESAKSAIDGVAPLAKGEPGHCLRDAPCHGAFGGL